jgi:uncharacterized membrane protein SirB2
MLEFYPQIKFVHVLCVVLSGSLFALRGTLMLSGSPFVNHGVLRHASYAIDTTLLTAALMLVMILRQYPFVQAWLTVKVLLLVVYIVLGVFALRRGRTRRQRGLFFLTALTVYLFIVSVARTHDPRGILAVLLH